MKPLTTSVYTFSELIAGGYQYVDKTACIYTLIQEYKGQYFLSRPRRFGKSLLVSTLDAIFKGRRELFKGLAIDSLEYDWKKYPVIHLDLGAAQADTADKLRTTLTYLVDDQASMYKVVLTREGPAARLHELIANLGQAGGGKVVILIDEYDKPLLGHLNQPSAVEIQKVLKEFYSVVKTTEKYQRFVLLTGVSKFSKVSVFSDLNNLTDLTMSRNAATLLGYTEAELGDNFADYIERLAKRDGVSVEQIRERLRDWYNGYRFHHESESVYNPVSVMKCFHEQEFKNYWFETGTPTFLTALLKRKPVDLGDLAVAEIDFSTYEPGNLEPLPLLVQTGYLTIKGVESFGETRTYRLGYPNREIEQSFSRWLALEYSELPAPELMGTLQRMVSALNAGDVAGMLETLRVFFANIPNTITIANEKYYQTILFTVFKLIGAVIEAETSSNIGRADAVVKTEKDIFILEFKLKGTAKSAMKQIREKRYFEPFLQDGRRITLVGVAFDAKGRNLGKWLIEPV